MKKGQTEIFGLIVIVILIVLILGFVILFALGSIGHDSNDIRKNLQAHKMADAILQYTPACPNEAQKDMRKIIKDCDFTANTQICGKPCVDLITSESKSIIDSVHAVQPTIQYGLTLEKAGKTLTIAQCTSDTIITDRTPDPAFSLTVQLCT